MFIILIPLVVLFYSDRYLQKIRGKEIPPRKDVVCLLYGFSYAYLNVMNALKSLG